MRQLEWRVRAASMCVCVCEKEGVRQNHTAVIGSYVLETNGNNSWHATYWKPDEIKLYGTAIPK